jgi:uncharacterized YigZ family protein
MPAYSYSTIKLPAHGLYKERGSKFLAFAFPVTTEADIKQHLDALRKEYHDARHHCFAFMLGADKKHFRAFDDGEPNHSAGDPILGQIRSRNLTNILVVVVRYFGGIKLGVGGLITAYKAAAEDALNNATFIECDVKESLTITYSYASTPDVMRMVKEYDLTIINQKFETTCDLQFEVALRDYDALLDKIKLLQITGVDMAISGV